VAPVFPSAPVAPVAPVEPIEDGVFVVEETTCNEFVVELYDNAADEFVDASIKCIVFVLTYNDFHGLLLVPIDKFPFLGIIFALKYTLLFDVSIKIAFDE
jgi:hypothetical protein